MLRTENLSTFICPHKYNVLLVSLARLVTGCLPCSPPLLLLKSALASSKTQKDMHLTQSNIVVAFIPYSCENIYPSSII